MSAKGRGGEDPGGTYREGIIPSLYIAAFLPPGAWGWVVVATPATSVGTLLERILLPSGHCNKNLTEVLNHSLPNQKRGKTSVCARSPRRQYGSLVMNSDWMFTLLLLSGRLGVVFCDFAHNVNIHSL